MKTIVKIIAGCLLCCVGCSSVNRTPNLAHSEAAYSRFSAIVVSNANVQLQNGPQHVELKAPVNNYKIWVANRTLHVTGSAWCKDHGVVIVQVPNLYSIQVKGSGRVFSDDFRSNKLTINASGRGEVVLKGQQCVTKITQRDRSRIDLSWISSEHLMIDGSGKGLIYLAGVVNELLVKLTSNAHLEARYLRAKTANIFVTDHAQAHVIALDKLGVYAVDKAAVFYYKIPKQLTVISQNSGKVLRVGWLQ